MRLATWNINGLRARFDFLLHWLEAREPDLVALQELKLDDDAFPHDELASVGYAAVAHGQKSWNGVALLSRVGRPEVTQVGLPAQESMGARLLSARVDGLEMCSVYCPNGKHVGHEDFGHKLAWFDALLEHLEANHDPQEPFVLGGDFNLCPDERDTWNEQLLRGGIFHTDEERDRYRRLLDWGLTDLYRDLYPDDRMFSWWDYRAGAFHKNQGLRIDFLLGTRVVAARAREGTIDRDYRKKKDGMIASDHAPVLVELAE